MASSWRLTTSIWHSNARWRSNGDSRTSLHRAEANRSGLDYIGSGVNQAARISAEANESEVLVSVSSLEGARHSFREVGRRTLTLRGIPDPVEVASIAWD